MSREQKLNKATALIQGLIPSIMELKEGDKVKLKSGKFRLVTRIIEEDFKELNLYEIGNAFYYRKDFVVCSEIHLEDVMSAFEKGCGQDVNYTTGDGFYLNEGMYIDYNMNKPFTEQTEEFYEFIIKTFEK